MSLGFPYRNSPRWRVLLTLGLTAVTAGCTFMPRGAHTLQRQAVLAGRPFLKSPQERHLPPLSAVPAPRELVRRALLNSPDVEAAYWRWRAAIEAIAQRGTETTVPALGATVGLKNGAASYDSTMLQLANMSSAPIEWPSKPLAEARAALQRAYAAGWQYRRAQFAVRRQTLDAWYRLVADSAMLDLLRRDAVLLRELDAFARARVEAGAVSPTAVLTIENGLTRLRAMMAAVSAELPADRAALNRIIGRPVRRPMRVPEKLPRIPLPHGGLTRMLTLAVRRNPDLAALRRDIRAGRIDIERAKMNYIPDFSLSAVTTLDGITQNLGGAIMFPFVRYQAINASIHQNRDWLRESEAELRSGRLSIAARVVADLVIVQSDTRRINLYEGVLLPRLQRLAAFARTDVEQNQGAIDEPVQIERTRVQIHEAILGLRLDEVERLADMDALLASRLENAN
ncbi:MAG: hypothetical protein B7Z66_11640 [Chromatiales bacterium 21-64-14]|nr:MAG: hypothetical protein B7Z66_11640 [Chromatiales bacterium 21-64-14]